MNQSCEFLAIADCEGGVVDLVVEHGVDEDALPEDVQALIAPMAKAISEFEAAVKAWHDNTCDDAECFWRGYPM